MKLVYFVYLLIFCFLQKSFSKQYLIDIEDEDSVR